MSKRGFLLLALLATMACTGVASAQTFYANTWGTYADGCMNNYPVSTDAPNGEGYAINGEGTPRFTKLYHHMAYMGFNYLSDNSNGTRPGGWQGHADDGSLLADWMVNKKAFAAVVYFRDASNQICDPTQAAGVYLNSPVEIIGFRVANTGPFVDRGTDANGALLDSGHGGCCADYTAPLLDGGENAPPAWRMGRPDTDWSGTMGYATIGAIGVAAAGATPEYYKVSSVDTVNPNMEVKVGNAAFGTAGTGGYSTNSGLAGTGRFAFDWLVETSDAMLVSSGTITEADCSGSSGGEEPRDLAADLNFGEGWYAKKVDACIIYAMAFDPECKGLVFSSAKVSTGLNTGFFSRDQGAGGVLAQGTYAPYIHVVATLMGDFDNSGAVDVIDLLTLVPTFGLLKGDPGFDPEVDSDCNGGIDVIDLLNMIANFGLSL